MYSCSPANVNALHRTVACSEHQFEGNREVCQESDGSSFLTDLGNSNHIRHFWSTGLSLSINHVSLTEAWTSISLTSTEFQWFQLIILLVQKMEKWILCVVECVSMTLLMLQWCCRRSKVVGGSPRQYNIFFSFPVMPLLFLFWTTRKQKKPSDKRFFGRPLPKIWFPVLY